MAQSLILIGPGMIQSFVFPILLRNCMKAHKKSFDAALLCLTGLLARPALENACQFAQFNNKNSNKNEKEQVHHPYQNLAVTAAMSDESEHRQ